MRQYWFAYSGLDLAPGANSLEENDGPACSCGWPPCYVAGTTIGGTTLLPL